MALRRRNWQDDLLWLRWPLVFLTLAVAIAVSAWWTAASYRNSVQREEFNASNELDLLIGQVREIEEAEQIIVNNIGIYNAMVARGVMAAENRVALLDDIADIRARYNFYPISVDISEQDRRVIPFVSEVDFPTEQISLRSSRISLQLSLLHEEDLTRLINELLATGRLLAVDRCAVNYALESEENSLTLVQHQIAACELYWYSFQREPYIDPDYASDFE
ncbi:MAG: hypothetical protein PsegKO_31150 [Pseudohongiellaceae bacterium]|jgi:hypothetical protein